MVRGSTWTSPPYRRVHPLDKGPGDTAISASSTSRASSPSGHPGGGGHHPGQMIRLWRAASSKAHRQAADKVAGCSSGVMAIALVSHVVWMIATDPSSGADSGVAVLVISCPAPWPGHPVAHQWWAPARGLSKGDPGEVRRGAGATCRCVTRWCWTRRAPSTGEAQVYRPYPGADGAEELCACRVAGKSRRSSSGSGIVEEAGARNPWSREGFEAVHGRGREDPGAPSCGNRAMLADCQGGAGPDAMIADELAKQGKTPLFSSSRRQAHWHHRRGGHGKEFQPGRHRGSKTGAAVVKPLATTSAPAEAIGKGAADQVVSEGSRR